MFKYLLISSVMIAFSIVLTGCNLNSNEGNDLESGLDLVQYVDAIIGTGETAHTYPGATLQHGMVQLSPNNGSSAWDYTGGYYYDDRLVRFGHTQLLGTGAGDLNDILVWIITPSNDYHLILLGQCETQALATTKACLYNSSMNARLLI